MTTRGSDFLGMRVWVTSPEKPLRTAKVIVEGDVNLEQIAEEWKDEYQVWP